MLVAHAGKVVASLKAVVYRSNEAMHGRHQPSPAKRCSLSRSRPQGPPHNGPNIVPKILTNTIFDTFSHYYMEDKKIHDVIRTYTDINAYTHLYAPIYAFTCIYTHIYAYLNRKEKIHDMNISSLGPPR